MVRLLLFRGFRGRPGRALSKVVNQWVTYNLTKPTRTFGVASIDGKHRTVITKAIPFDAPYSFGTAPSERASGPLTDLGAPDLTSLTWTSL